MGGADDDAGGAATLVVLGLGSGLGDGDCGGGGGACDVGGACTLVEVVELVSGSWMKTPGLAAGVVEVKKVVLAGLVLGMTSSVVVSST